MKALARWPLIFLLVMLQGMMPLLHVHIGMAEIGHAGLHLPEVGESDAGTKFSKSEFKSDSMARTIVIADFLQNLHDDPVALPPQAVELPVVAELESGTTWVTTPSPRLASLQGNCLIPYSCAPPRA